MCQLEPTLAEVKQQEDNDREVERQAAAFAAKVPEPEFSPAEIMSYLVPYRHSPAAAIENRSQWVDDLLQEK
jgi:chaperone BCS1